MKTNIALVAALLLSPFATAAEAPPKLNICFLLADDLRPDCLGVLGHPLVKRPNLDKLLERGFIFRDAYVLGSNSGAVCMPSRTMIQTGQSYLRKNPTTPTLAQIIKAAANAYQANPR
jgi:arylsulfatase A-like enzyme